MAMRVACLDCGKTFTVGAKPSAKPEKCPKCGSTAQIQLLETGQASASVPPTDEAPVQPVPVEVPVDRSDEPPEDRESAGKIASTETDEPQAPLRPEKPGPRPASESKRPALPKSAWITVAAVGVVLLVSWAIYSAFQGGGQPEKVAVDSPGTAPAEPAADQQPIARPETPESPPSELDSSRPRDAVESPVDEPGLEPSPDAALGPDTKSGAETTPARETLPAREAGLVLDVPPGPEAAPRVETQPLEFTSPPARVAGSLDEAKDALVKFEMPLGIGDLAEHGTGFLIDPRGWIATNNHLLARMTTDARVKLANGNRLEIAGIIARAPQRDLAIVKLKDPPPELTVLDIGFEGKVPLGEEVYAFGHPYETEFSLSKGIVSRVLTTAELVGNSQQHLVAKLGAPADMVWIQHDAKISPGNSGGPLIDDRGRVFGVNTFVHMKAEFGYASHVEYLRELARSVSEQIEPLPGPREILQAKISSQRIDQLFDGITTFGWKPATAEQYESLAELAKQMTLAKYAQTVRSRTPALAAEAVQRAAHAADQRFAALRQVPWSTGHFEAINSFATDQIDKVWEGAFLYSTVLGSVKDQNALLMNIEGTGKSMILRVGANAARLPPGSRWLVVGFVTPQVLQVQNQNRSVDQAARVVLARYMMLVGR